MLRQALREPRNQRFMLLSDSGVPLYPPTTFWLQLTSESKSRIDACHKVRRQGASTTLNPSSATRDTSGPAA